MPLAQHKQGIQLHDIEATLSVAETGSFRKAAGRMVPGQSAVGRRVQWLEGRLGVSLLERRPSGAQLTPAGACFALRARAILDDLYMAAEIARAAGVAKNGHLTIGVIAFLSRGPFRVLFRNFLKEHEDVDVSEIGDGLLLAHWL